MPNDNMPNDNMPNDNMPNDNMPNDNMPNDNMPNDNMPMSTHQMTSHQMEIHLYTTQRSHFQTQSCLVYSACTSPHCSHKTTQIILLIKSAKIQYLFTALPRAKMVLVTLAMSFFSNKSFVCRTFYKTFSICNLLFTCHNQCDLKMIEILPYFWGKMAKTCQISASKLSNL